MNADLLTAGLANVAVGAIGIVVSIPLLKGWIKRNRWYGIRIRKAFASEENWRKINAYGARALIAWSIPILLIGLAAVLAAPFCPPTSPKDLIWFLPVALCSLLILGALKQTLSWSARLPDDGKS